MKLNTSPRVGLKDPDLQRVLRDTANQVNALTEGRISAVYNADTAAPLAGEYVKGDFVRNSAPSGTTPTIGWVCTADGTPGTWVAVYGGRVDTLDDVIVDDSANGLVLKSPDAHYWRITVDNAGALTTTDLGTVKP